MVSYTAQSLVVLKGDVIEKEGGWIAVMRRRTLEGGWDFEVMEGRI